MGDGITCETCGKTRSPRLPSCPYCRAATTAGTPARTKGASSTLWKVLLGLGFLGGLVSSFTAFVGDGVFIMLDESPLPIGAAIAATVLAWIGARISVWLQGGYEAVNAEMRREATAPPPMAGLAGAAAAGAFAYHAKHGYSRRDVRILHAFMLWPPLFAGLCLGGRALNSRLAAEEVDVSCWIVRMTRAKPSEPFHGTLTCRLPDGSTASGSDYFEVKPRMDHARVRHGRLGIWLLPRESIPSQ